MLTAPERRTNRAARTYLLSGLCRCAKCGTKMVSGNRARLPGRRYLCRSGIDSDGCGSMTITAEPVETFVTEMVLYRFDSPELHDALAGRVRDDAAASALHDQIDNDTVKLTELAEMWATNDIDSDQFKRAKAIIEKRRDTTRRDLSRLSGTRDLDAYLGQGDALRDTWQTLTLDRQRAIIKTVLDHVEIRPGVMEPAR